jgi:hypothetical protein
MAQGLDTGANSPNFGHFLSKIPKTSGLLATTPPPEVYLKPHFYTGEFWGKLLSFFKKALYI